MICKKIQHHRMSICLFVALFVSFFISLFGQSSDSYALTRTITLTSSSVDANYIVCSPSSSYGLCSDWEDFYVKVTFNNLPSFNYDTSQSNFMSNFSFSLRTYNNQAIQSGNNFLSLYPYKTKDSNSLVFHFNKSIYAFFRSGTFDSYYDYMGLVLYNFSQVKSLFNSDTSIVIEFSTSELLPDDVDCPEPEEPEPCPPIPDNPYDDKFDNVIKAIYTCGAILIMLYFFFCIYQIIIKPNKGAK